MATSVPNCFGGVNVNAPGACTGVDVKRPPARNSWKKVWSGVRLSAQLVRCHRAWPGRFDSTSGPNFRMATRLDAYFRVTSSGECAGCSLRKFRGRFRGSRKPWNEARRNVQLIWCFCQPDLMRTCYYGSTNFAMTVLC